MRSMYSDQPQQPRRPFKHLEFNQAMQDFQTMFPSIGADIIEDVLRANKGAVDASIDSLLLLCVENESSGPPKPYYPPYTPRSNTPPPSYSSIRERPTSLNFAQQRSTQYNRVLLKWQPAMLGDLPPDFLRMPRSSGRIPASEYRAVKAGDPPYFDPAPIYADVQKSLKSPTPPKTPSPGDFNALNEATFSSDGNDYQHTGAIPKSGAKLTRGGGFAKDTLSNFKRKLSKKNSLTKDECIGIQHTASPSTINLLADVDDNVDDWPTTLYDDSNEFNDRLSIN